MWSQHLDFALEELVCPSVPAAELGVLRVQHHSPLPPTCSAQETPSTWLRLCFRAQLAPQPLTAFGPGVQQGVQPLMSGERRTPGIKYDVPRARSPRGPEDEEALKGGQAV